MKIAELWLEKERESRNRKSLRQILVSHRVVRLYNISGRVSALSLVQLHHKVFHSVQKHSGTAQLTQQNVHEAAFGNHPPVEGNPTDASSKVLCGEMNTSQQAVLIKLIMLILTHIYMGYRTMSAYNDCEIKMRKKVLLDDIFVFKFFNRGTYIISNV